MSRLSIYANGWINLVFEGRNQAYGAFQLRQKSDETTLLAFCLGVSLVAMLATIPMLISSFTAFQPAPITDPVFDSPQVHLTHVQLPQPKPPVSAVLPAAKKKQDDAVEKKQLRNPEIVAASPTLPDIAKNNEPVKSNDPVENPGAGKGNNPETVTTPTVSATLPAIPESDSRAVLNTATVDKIPDFPGGLKAFYEYVSENFEKPEIEETVSVIMTFVVEKDGSMTDIHVLRSASPSIDREAVRVLKSLKTKWKPGLKNGKPVRTEYKLPIKIEK